MCLRMSLLSSSPPLTDCHSYSGKNARRHDLGILLACECKRNGFRTARSEFRVHAAFLLHGETTNKSRPRRSRRKGGTSNTSTKLVAPQCQPAVQRRAMV